MFPIRDHNPSERIPFVTYALIAINILVFLSYFPGGSEIDHVLMYRQWGFTPALNEPTTYFTSQFLHGGWMHLFGNMLFLFIFGDNMEDEMGHVGFLIFYLASGVLAAFSQGMMDWSSFTPMVGASGAIAGVMGGYLLLFPKARVDILIILIIILRIIPVPAWLMLGLWFGLQLVQAALDTGTGGGTAFAAHAGGFIAGLLLTIPIWLRLGGPVFWDRTHGHPDHPEARYKLVRTTVPQVRRRR
ncbi:MAG: rhomboid family intramembrane serine protease [Pseudomonadota bacterium]